MTQPSSTSQTQPRGRQGELALLVLLLVVHCACGVHTALVKSVTHDEIWHLPVGLLHWRTGKFDQDILNPPLTRMWAAAPAAIAGVAVEPGRDATDIAHKFVSGHEDFFDWYAWGRVCNLLGSLLTVWIVYQWSRDWFGGSSAVLAAALCATSPNILAHASLVTPDAGLMLGFTATLWLFVRWRERPTWTRALLLGAVLGLTQATKFTAVLLYPLLAVLPLLIRSPSSPRLRTLLGQAASAFAVSLVVWNGAFLFEGTGRRLADYVPESRALRTLQSVAGPLARLPLPLPADYVAGIDRQRWVMEQPHPIYLDGVWSTTGFPDYFLKTLEYKLPHVLQLGAILGLAALLLSRGRPQRWGRLAVFLLPTISLLGIASFSSMQLGVRYVLPILPLLMILASSAAARLDALSLPTRGIVMALALAACGWSLRHHPHHLAYFNEASGGPVEGRHHLLDSNLDWGQDLSLVRTFMQEHGLDEIGLVYFGTLYPERLGIRYHVPPGRRPEPGWHAVSVNYVMGRPHRLHTPDGGNRSADIHEFSDFQRFEPVARLGYSIDVYHIPEQR